MKPRPQEIDSYCLDDSGKSPAWFAPAATSYISMSAAKDWLKSQCTSASQSNGRVCLHQDSSSVLHHMVVLEWKDTPTRPHYHPAPKSETFLIHEGRLRVVIFSADLCPVAQYSLTVGEVLRIPDFVVHWVKPITPYCLYTEIKLGPKCEIDAVTPPLFRGFSVTDIEEYITNTTV